MLLLRWFYEVVDANCWFLQWLWMTMVVFHWFLCEISPTTDPQPSWLRFGGRRRRRSRSTFASEQPQATESDHAASPRLARSHARTKRNDFPVGVTRTHPPNLQYIYIYIYIYMYVCKGPGALSVCRYR